MLTIITEGSCMILYRGELRHVMLEDGDTHVVRIELRNGQTLGIGFEDSESARRGYDRLVSKIASGRYSGVVNMDAAK